MQDRRIIAFIGGSAEAFAEAGRDLAERLIAAVDGRAALTFKNGGYTGSMASVAKTVLEVIQEGTDAQMKQVRLSQISTPDGCVTPSADDAHAGSEIRHTGFWMRLAELTVGDDQLNIEVPDLVIALGGTQGTMLEVAATVTFMTKNAELMGQRPTGGLIHVIPASPATREEPDNPWIAATREIVSAGQADDSAKYGDDENPHRIVQVESNGTTFEDAVLRLLGLDGAPDAS